MSYHEWGDPDFDWDGLDDAIYFIDRRLRRWRVDVRQSKEKYGSARIYCSLGIQWWPQLTHPGYVYNQWPRWMNWWVYGSYRKWHPGNWILHLINWVIVPFHVWLYRDTYRKAVERWPHLYDEIVAHADFGELFEGHIPGYIHSNYWTKVT